MAELIGKILLNRYRVDSFIGRGGMAEVYKIWDQQRAVFLAMKLLREELAEDKVFLRRFRRESQNLAQLQHPHIVRSYGLELEGRLAFLLMDYVDGSSLRGEIYDSEIPLSSQRVMEIMPPVCSALHYAHQMDMVHCDVKPANIMIQKNGTVLLADFGIARMTDAATATMVGAGTPAYMAPEQVRGEHPAPQTDIYALGVVLYEMLTGGERPFTGEHAQTTGSTSEKVRWEQMNLAAPSPRRYNPAISPELEAVVMKCLEKDPGKRYPSALDMLNALGQAMPEPGELRVEAGVGGRLDQAERQEPGPVGVASSPSPQAPRVRPGGKSRKTPAWFWVLLGGTAIIVFITGVFLSNNSFKPSPAVETPYMASLPANTMPKVIERVVMVTAEPVTSRPAPTATAVPPTPTVTPTQTPNIIKGSLEDSFNDKAFDGLFNSDVWHQVESDEGATCIITQKEGALLFSQTVGLMSSFCGLDTKITANWLLADLGQVEARLKLTEKEGDEWAGIQLDIVSNDIDWFMSCHIGKLRKDDPYLNCWTPKWESPPNPGGVGASFNTWHKFRMVIDPETVTFKFYIDGYSYASFTPPEAAELKDDSFRVEIGLWNIAKTSASAYVDDVYIGAKPK